MVNNTRVTTNTRHRLMVVANHMFAYQRYQEAPTAEICEQDGANIYPFRDKKNLCAETWWRVIQKALARHPLHGKP